MIDERAQWPVDDLPPKWQWLSFDEVFDDVTDSARKLKQKQYEPAGQFPVVDQGERFIGGYTSEASLLHPCEPPFLIFGDHTRCIKYVEFRFVQGADGVKVLKPKAVVSDRYAHLLLQTMILPDKGYSRHMKFVRKSVFPIAPLPEQERIVSAVEEMLGRTRRIRIELLRVAPLAAKLREAILSAAFEKVRDKATWTPLGKVVERITSGSRDWSQYYNKGNAVFVLAGNVKPLAFDPIPKQFVDPPRNGADAKRTKIAKDDLLITIVGANTGDVCRVTSDVSDYYVCQSVAIVRLQNPKLAPLFELFLNTTSFGRGQILAAQYGEGRPHLGFDDIKALTVPVMDTDVAAASVEEIVSALASIRVVTEQARRGLSLLERLERQALSSALGGRLFIVNGEKASRRQLAS